MSDIQIQVFNSNGKEGLALNVPEGSFGFEVYNSGQSRQFLHYRIQHTSTCIRPYTYDLPEGNYEIPGRLNELSEEQLIETGIVPEEFFQENVSDDDHGKTMTETVLLQITFWKTMRGIFGNPLILIKK